MRPTKARQWRYDIAPPKIKQQSSRETMETMVVTLFSTNVRCECALLTVKPALDEIPGVASWTIDLSDCDKVLRIVSNCDVMRPVLDALKRVGYTCSLMPY